MSELEAALALQAFDANTPPDELTNIVDALTSQMRAFDPRFDPRVGEQGKMRGMTVGYDQPQVYGDPISIFDLEGKPFVTSMSDRLGAGGNTVSIDGFPLHRPVGRFGGQRYPYLPESLEHGRLWASADSPVQQILDLSQELKRQTGQDPLFMPWTMSPTGGDFSSATGEVMLNYAASNMDRTTRRHLNDRIKNYESVGKWDKEKQKYVGKGLKIKNFKGIGHPNMERVWRETPDQLRKELKAMMDRDFRDEGGLSIGEARLAVADPTQLTTPDTMFSTVGRIFADEPMGMESGHPSYPRSVMGEPLGILEEDVRAFEMLPGLVDERNLRLDKYGRARNRPIDVRNPEATDKRAMQMKPYGGIITDALLRQYESRVR